MQREAHIYDEWVDGRHRISAFYGITKKMLQSHWMIIGMRLWKCKNMRKMDWGRWEQVCCRVELFVGDAKYLLLAKDSDCHFAIFSRPSMLTAKSDCTADRQRSTQKTLGSERTGSYTGNYCSKEQNFENSNVLGFSVLISGILKSKNFKQEISHTDF